ncbi:MAG: hypothetical protein ACKPBB_00835 [Sphaerospermopsis kisseleviana]
MITYTEPDHKLPTKIESGSGKLKTIILGGSLVLGLLFYSQSIKQPKVVELSTNAQSLNYRESVESLADNYLLIAGQNITTPGNVCFKLTVNDCLEHLKPERPKQFKTLEPEKAINSELRQLGYQIRIDAIGFAQTQSQEVNSNSSI